MRACCPSALCCDMSRSLLRSQRSKNRGISVGLVGEFKIIEGPSPGFPGFPLRNLEISFRVIHWFLFGKIMENHGNSLKFAKYVEIHHPEGPNVNGPSPQIPPQPNPSSLRSGPPTPRSPTESRGGRSGPGFPGSGASPALHLRSIWSRRRDTRVRTGPARG